MSDRLRRLRELLPTAEAHAAQTKESSEQADKTVRDIKQAIARENGKRRHLRGLVMLPVAGSAALTAKEWAARHPGTTKITAGAAVVAAAGVVAITAIQGGGDPHITDRPRPPAAAPPGAHASPRPGPAKPPNPAPPGKPAPPAPGEPPTGQAPRTTPPDPPSTPPHTTYPSAPGNQHTPPPGEVGTRDDDSCRIRLPHILRHGLLCGRLLGLRQI